METKLNSIRGEKRGFALVVALSLMSLMLLIALSLATLTKTELATSSVVSSQSIARENARLGLLIALGHLQSAAGADQRVTGRADINSDQTLPNDLWTGVWDTTDASLLTWLVSGNENPTAPKQFTPESVLEDYVTLFGNLSTEYQVRAPLQEVGSGKDGHFAYWVMDEGVKARLNLVNPEWGTDDEAQSRRARETSWRFGIEEMEAWESMRASRGLPDWGDRMANLISQDQAAVLHELATGTQYGDDWTAHDLSTTVVSRSLPVNVRDGGFQKDLSGILESDFDESPYSNSDVLIENAVSPMPTWGVLRSFSNPWSDWEDANAVLPSIAPRIPNAEQAGLFPLPVLVQIGWGTIRSGTGEGATLLITMKPVVALANPYDVSLAPADYQLEVRPDPGRGLMMISFEPEPDYNSSDFEVGVHTRATEFFPKDRLGEYPTLTVSGVSFEPGEVKLFGLAVDGEYRDGEGGAIMSEAYPTDNFVWKDTGRELGSYTRSPEGKVTMQISGGRYSIAYKLKVDGVWESLQLIENIGIGISPSSNQLNDGGQPKVQVSLEPDGEGELPPSVNLLRRRFSTRSSATDYVSDSYSGTGLRWLADFNPRASAVNTRPPDWSSHPLWLADAGNTNNQLPLNADWITDFQYDSTGDARGFWGASTNAIGESVVTLFSVPRQPLTSLGSLQHAPLSGRVWDPTYALGNSYASPHVETGSVDLSYELNDFFWDGYFFSSLFREDEDAGWHALNPRMDTLLEPGNSVYDSPALAAAGMLIQGGFNINSTSVEAWKALLSNFAGQGMLYYDTGSETTVEVDLQNSFFRSINPNGGANQLWSGYRELTTDQIENLAAQIVYRIRERGRPFLSLSEFVNRPLDGNVGLIQEAIDSETSVELDGVEYGPTGINSAQLLPSVTTYDNSAALNPTAGLGARSTAAPGWLTQADILMAIGPYLSVRSDTFIIRSYGDCRNPVTNRQEAEAYCEAVVQRFPEPVAPTSDSPGEVGFYEPSNELGRRFKIIGFRWLNREDI